MLLIWLSVFIASLLISLGLSKWWLSLAWRFKILDKPDGDRKLHLFPRPFGGGVAVVVAVILTMALAGLFFPEVRAEIFTIKTVGILAALLLVLIGGIFDDIKPRSPRFQFIWPVLGALVVIIFGVLISTISRPGGGWWYLSQVPVLATFLSFVWLLGMMYATKLYDGVDGLLTTQVAGAAMVLFMVGNFYGLPLSFGNLLSLALLGGCLGFLFFNWHPAKMFLGEGGSLALGLFLGIISILSGAKLATAALVMGLPILDVLWVMFRRKFVEKKPVTLGDRKHLHHRLLNLGLSQPQTVGVLAGVSFLLGLASLIASTWGKIFAFLLLALLLTSFGLYLTVKKIRTN